MKEGDRIKQRLLAQKPNERLFRINAGMGWAGEILKKTKDMLVLKNPYPFRAAPVGWHDLCGWETIEITQEMVGQEIAVFKFVEVKLTGKLSKGQRLFRDLLEAMGGICELITK